MIIPSGGRLLPASIPFRFLAAATLTGSGRNHRRDGIDPKDRRSE